MRKPSDEDMVKCVAEAQLGPLTPAVRFRLIREATRPQPRTRLGRCDDYDKQTLIDLIGNDDIPLDKDTRKDLKRELRRLLFPTPHDRQDERRLQNQALEEMRRTYRDDGMTTAEAEAAIVASDLGTACGIKTVEALQRRLRPSRK
jgi:hypothetical protein